MHGPLSPRMRFYRILAFGGTAVIFGLAGFYFGYGVPAGDWVLRDQILAKNLQIKTRNEAWSKIKNAYPEDVHRIEAELKHEVEKLQAKAST